MGAGADRYISSLPRVWKSFPCHGRWQKRSGVVDMRRVNILPFNPPRYSSDPASALSDFKLISARDLQTQRFDLRCELLPSQACLRMTSVRDTIVSHRVRGFRYAKTFSSGHWAKRFAGRTQEINTAQSGGQFDRITSSFDHPTNCLRQ